MPRKQGAPAHDRPDPTPMIFHPVDGIHLRARRIIEKCPSSPNGRWVLPRDELLPDENPYVRFLRPQGIRCRMPALLHSKETLEFLGLDAVMAEKCWVRWTRLNKDQRQTMPASLTQEQLSYEQSEPVKSSLPAFLALVQTQMLERLTSEWNRELSPEERVRRLESNNSRTDSNRLPFGQEQMPNGQQINNSWPGDLTMPQQNGAAIDSGQGPTVPFNDNMMVPNNNMTAPFNDGTMPNLSAGAFPTFQDQTFGPSNQPTGESVPAANAGPSTIYPSGSSGSSNGRGGSSAEATPGVKAARKVLSERIPLLGPQSNTPSYGPVNANVEAQVLRFFGVRPEALWHAYHVMTNLELRKYVGLTEELSTMKDFVVFATTLYAVLTVDVLMAVVIVPRFKMLLQVKRMSEVRAKMWLRMPAAASNRAVAASIMAVPRCVDPVVPASQSGSGPQDPMAAVEQSLQACIDSLRRQGVNANDCTKLVSMRYKHIPPGWLASPIDLYIKTNNAKEQAEMRRRNNGIRSTGADDNDDNGIDGDEGAVVVNGQHETKKLKAECEWDFLREVCWEGMPMGNLWDVAHAERNPSP